MLKISDKKKGYSQNESKAKQIYTLAKKLSQHYPPELHHINLENLQEQTSIYRKGESSTLRKVGFETITCLVMQKKYGDPVYDYVKNEMKKKHVRSQRLFVILFFRRRNF